VGGGLLPARGVSCSFLRCAYGGELVDASARCPLMRFTGDNASIDVCMLFLHLDAERPTGLAAPTTRHGFGVIVISQRVRADE
jgi:hypothetical protein